jgi:MFS family permease
MEIVSGVGDGMFWVGLTAMLLARNVGPAGFTLAALARLGPRALISAPAGVLADRVDRRRLLIALDLIRAALMVVLAFVAHLSSPLPAMFVIVLATYTAAAPYRPALTAALPLVAGESGLSSANALVATVRQLMTFIGPLLGALLVRVWSPSVAFFVNALSFVVAGLLIAAVKEFSGHPGRRAQVAPGDAGWRKDVVAGWHALTAVSGLAVVTVLVFVMYIARGAELVLFVLLADGRLGLGGAGVGLLTGAVGLGALVVLPMSRTIAGSRRPTLMMAFGLATTAVPFVILGSIHSTVLACLLLVVLGGGVVAFELTSVVLLQRLSRRDALGTVFGLVGATSNGGKLVGALMAPWLARSLGITEAMTISGFVVLGLGLFAVPGLVRLARSTRARQDQLAPIAEALSRLGLFEGASQPVLERLAAEAEPVRITPGTVVLWQGAPADDLYVVRSGTFTVHDGERPINQVNGGEWFGEIGLLQRRPRTATVVADGEALVWRIPGEVFLDALAEGAAEPMALVEVMGDRLRRSQLARQGPGNVTA